MSMRCSLLALMLLFLAQTAPAQPEPNDMLIAFDPSYTTLCTHVGGFITFPLYVVAYAISDLNGWEASVTISDPGWAVLSHTFNPPSALNFGDPLGNFVVGLGACVQAGAGFTPLVTYSMGYLASPIAPNDALVCLGPAYPSSLGGVPGYQTCANELVPLRAQPIGDAFYPAGCSVINPLDTCPVGVEELSFGAIKSRF